MEFPIEYPAFLTFQHVGMAVAVIEGQHAEAKNEDVEEALNYLYDTEAYLHLQGSLARLVVEHAQARRTAEYCDHCGEVLGQQRVVFKNLPFNVASANKGESAVLCVGCHGRLNAGS